MITRSLHSPFLLWALLACYAVPFVLVVGSLSVPPADLPICGLAFIVAVVGLVLAWRATRIWRIIWVGALAASLLLGTLEFIAGRRLAQQRSRRVGAAAPNVQRSEWRRWARVARPARTANVKRNPVPHEG